MISITWPIRRTSVEAGRGRHAAGWAGRLAGLTLTLLAAGCASLPTAPAEARAPASAPQPAALAEVLERLRQAPQDARLHALYAVLLHRQALAGDTAAWDLAEAGYQMALQLDPAIAPARLGLARFYLDRHRFADAKVQLSHAAIATPDNATVLMGLAVSAYNSGDISTALAAIERAQRLAPPDAELTRDAAIIYAVAGLTGPADQKAELLGVPLVTRRVNMWTQLHSQVAQLGPAAAAAPAPVQTTLQPGAAPPAGADWLACHGPQAQTVGYQPPTMAADETQRLPSLPVPCAGAALPRMVVVDAVLVRVSDQGESSRGVNLMQGLQAVVNASRGASRSGPSGDNPTINTSTWGISLPTGGIAYMLNIADSTNSRNEVLARPSLIALDRQPSNFFSGSTLSVSLTGQYGGEIVDKPVGLSLSVTPTFVDDDTVLLSVRAVRSFFEETTTDLDQSFQTARNAVTASLLLRMGETMVLSGLNEREVESSKNGVPILRDTPLVQNFFAHREDRDVRNSVMIFLTPRRPVAIDPSRLPPPGRPEDGGDPTLAMRLEASIVPSRNLDSVIRSLGHSQFMNLLDLSDVTADEWRDPGQLQRLTDDLGMLLKF